MNDFDVVIFGAGLAGLSLARHFLIHTDAKVLHLEKRKAIPTKRQKLGESTVQVAGYYFSKVLDLEEHLFHKHFMKYNLRFHWRTTDGETLEDFSSGFIRNFSNIASYQFDRNTLEEHLIEENLKSDRYQLVRDCGKIGLEIGPPHQVSYLDEGTAQSIEVPWVVDTTGWNSMLSRKLKTQKTSEVKHNSSYFWVDGNLNLEKLSQRSPKERRLAKERKQLGHLPFWLATNHFVGEGFWVWVIPLQGKTSIGLVYDPEIINPKAVAKKESLIQWFIDNFPLFKSFLDGKEIIDFTVMNQYSKDTLQTIHKKQWAISGPAGRFNDPLYSPGSDQIAIHNSLIVDAVMTKNPQDLSFKISVFESLCKSIYQSFLPSFGNSYRALGDPETFALKYVWELSIYFIFFVFPFINDLFTNRYFLIPYFRRFATLGARNRDLLEYITAYYLWKKEVGLEPKEPIHFDFSSVDTLKRAESCFYEVGCDVKEAVAILEKRLKDLEELARYTVAHIDSVVTNQKDLPMKADYVAQINLDELVFDPEQIRERAVNSGSAEQHWQLCPKVYWQSFQEKTMEKES